GNHGGHGGGVDFTVGGQQAKLLDLLGGGQQVALHPVGQHLDGAPVGANPRIPEALANPLGQALGVHRPHLDQGAGAVQSLVPFAPQGAGVQFAGNHQQQVVGGGGGAVLLDGPRTLVAGLAGGHAEFEDLALGE